MTDDRENDDRDGRGASQITLCVFPHLSQLIAVDLRLADTKITEINVRDVIDSTFANELQRNFSSFLKPAEAVLADLASIPQQVENSIKVNLFKRVVELIEADGDGLQSGMLGVLFFTGDILWVDSEKWRQTLEDMFKDHFSDAQLEDLFQRLESMVSEERRLQGGGMRNSLRELISGSHDGFVTMWQRGENDN